MGSIGCSTMLHYAAQGHNVLGYDLSKKRVEEVNKGTISILGIEEWTDQPVEVLRKQKKIRATTNLEEFLAADPEVILIAVPTEVKGIPSSHIIASTFQWILEAIQMDKLKNPTIIVESTMAPRTVENVIIPLFENSNVEIGSDIFIGVSPRRDWFKVGGKSIKDMERVYGGVTENCATKTYQYLSIVCDTLFKASSYKVAELTKCLENAFRFVNISLANQFALAYPDIDIIETLDLAATKWNMEKYFPSLKVGGHCVPVAARYVSVGAKHLEYLSIVDASIKSENMVINKIIEKLMALNVNRVALLGLGYRDNIKVLTFSPAVTLINLLEKNNLHVALNAPLYSNEEVKEEVGVINYSLEDVLFNVSAIIITSMHQEYEDRQKEIVSNDHIKIVIDNSGKAKNWGWKNGVTYYQIGDGYLLQ
ncbi:MAG: nucleotide sugar dehydrogenase [Ignavibacteriae bacterium]|nr:nucleotide sugar dehydrogenase [Ignavibacteriota bacterium]